MRLFALDELRPPAGVPGAARIVAPGRRRRHRPARRVAGGVRRRAGHRLAASAYVARPGRPRARGGRGRAALGGRRRAGRAGGRASGHGGHVADRAGLHPARAPGSRLRRRRHRRGLAVGADRGARNRADLHRPREPDDEPALPPSWLPARATTPSSSCSCSPGRRRDHQPAADRRGDTTGWGRIGDVTRGGARRQPERRRPEVRRPSADRAATAAPERRWPGSGSPGSRPRRRSRRWAGGRATARLRAPTTSCGRWPAAPTRTSRCAPWTGWPRPRSDWPACDAALRSDVVLRGRLLALLGSSTALGDHLVDPPRPLAPAHRRRARPLRRRRDAHRHAARRGRRRPGRPAGGRARRRRPPRPDQRRGRRRAAHRLPRRAAGAGRRRPGRGRRADAAGARRWRTVAAQLADLADRGAARGAGRRGGRGGRQRRGPAGGDRDGQERRARAELRQRRRRRVRRRAGRRGHHPAGEPDDADRRGGVLPGRRQPATRRAGRARWCARWTGTSRYYKRWAKTWEFQALLKARPVAGDPELGAAYAEAVAPLVWTAAGRPDFVADVQAMRRRVEEHVRPDHADRELKLGRGGLRDVEFAVQLLQLVHGRADEALRSPTTLDALAALAEGGYVGRDDGANLAASYRFLRAARAPAAAAAHAPHPPAARRGRHRRAALAGPRGPAAPRRAPRRRRRAAGGVAAQRPAGPPAAREAVLPAAARRGVAAGRHRALAGGRHAPGSARWAGRRRRARSTTCGR